MHLKLKTKVEFAVISNSLVHVQGGKLSKSDNAKQKKIGKLINKKSAQPVSHTKQ